MDLNPKYYHKNPEELYLIIANLLDYRTIIKSVTEDVEYDVIVNDKEIFFKRLDANNKNEKTISKDQFLHLLKYIIESRKEINTTTIKPYIGGKQSPSLAILKYCEIIIDKKDTIKEAKNTSPLITKIDNISSWAFSIFFLLLSFGPFASSAPISGIIFLIASIVLYPPINRYSEKKFEYEMTRQVKITIIIVLFILAMIFSDTSVTFNSNAEKNQFDKPETTPTNNILKKSYSIKDISQNLKEYRDKNETIKIKGILGDGFDGGHYLEDSEGYYVLINKQSCLGINRNPKIGETYTVEGKLLKNNYGYYRLFCDGAKDTRLLYDGDTRYK